MQKNMKTYSFGIQTWLLRMGNLKCTGVQKSTHFGQKRGLSLLGEKGRFLFNQKYPFLAYFWGILVLPGTPKNGLFWGVSGDPL